MKTEPFVRTPFNHTKSERVRCWSPYCTHLKFVLFSDIALSHATTDVDEHNTVLTVPLDFNQAQRKIVTKAAEAAGFNVVQVSLILSVNANPDFLKI